MSGTGDLNLNQIGQWSLRLGICGLFLCAVEPVRTGALQAQRPEPVGVQRISDEAALGARLIARGPVMRSPSDSLGVDRAERAVWGAAIGGVIGVAVGYHRGKVADDRCGSECGGPKGLGPLVVGAVFGLVGSALGAIVGYVL